ncbi:hypothetical protein [Rhizobium sp. BK176]|uniref:hypothetical protein n=1 Tax=Rhizobium sp. BK176 TaxID=2587071 RepID=UPI00216AAE98|nr:hypothetical protein [Rhizobium sp. BK176]MCS4090224.1 hypothetical protein [Rhizobium sp. BK176]
MNKIQIGRSLSGAFAAHSVWSALAGGAVLSATLCAVVLFFAVVSHFGLRPPSAEPASYAFVAASILCFVATYGLAALGFRQSEQIEKAIREAWLVLFKGTEWRTPGGESGVVSDVNIDANKLGVTFSDRKTHFFPFHYLKPANAHGVEADFSGLDKNGSIAWRYYSSRTSTVLWTGLAWALTASFGWSILNADIPSWSMLPAAISLVFGAAIPLWLFAASAPFSSTENFDYPVLVSKTTWKALDGRVGIVRWAKRKYEGDNVYSETILLAFTEGDEEWFRRGDLKPTAFEC